AEVHYVYRLLGDESREVAQRPSDFFRKLGPRFRGDDGLAGYCCQFRAFQERSFCVSTKCTTERSEFWPFGSKLILPVVTSTSLSLVNCSRMPSESFAPRRTASATSRMAS